MLFVIGAILGIMAAIGLFAYLHHSCRHVNFMGHCYNCPCDEKVVLDGGGSLHSQGKKYEMFILDWCLDCGAVRTVHGPHQGPWDRPGYGRSKGMRDGRRAAERFERRQKDGQVWAS